MTKPTNFALIKDFAQDVAESITGELDYDIAKEIYDEECSEDWECALQHQARLRSCVYKWVKHYSTEISQFLEAEKDKP